MTRRVSSPASSSVGSSEGAEAPDPPEGARSAGFPPAAGTGPGRQRWITAAVVLLAFTGILVAVLDWQEVRDVLTRASWQWIPLAASLTALSYWCTSHSFALINQAFRIQLGWKDLLAVGFVSSAMIAAVGGLAGHALRVLIMVRRGLPAGDVLAPSLFHGYVESLAFFALIPVGLGYLLLTHPLSPTVATWLSVGTGLLGVAFAATAVVFFFKPAREIAFWVVRAFGKWFARRDLRPSINAFECTLRQGLSEVRERPLILLFPVVLVLADRIARVAVVWLCFQALGSNVDLGVAVTGFAIGVAAGVMSMVPGGVAIQEGSMAGTYHLLGVPLEEAVLVSILFRVVFYMAPFAVSLAFYRLAMKSKTGPLSRPEEQPAGLT